jgi:hypothetical protein
MQVNSFCPCQETADVTPTAGVAVTVRMLKADDPRATDAFEAAQVLREAKG